MRLLLLFFMLFCATILLGCNQIKSKVTIYNESKETLELVKVTIAFHEFEFKKISPNARRVALFEANDSSYVVFVRFSSGKILRFSGGYVTGGLAYNDRLNISENEIRLKSLISD